MDRDKIHLILDSMKDTGLQWLEEAAYEIEAFIEGLEEEIYQLDHEQFDTLEEAKEFYSFE